ncbi:glycoside hydrolase family 26 protein [uncultured Polaribacter sp.]|uniref:glycoside hydrolase family 26 protein n=1 Tax=uncultured Polaribacter sp. TaxID=174711 RepID=UPI00260AC114|nr:glycosyl hydrolase [uncultured Polaribacter sp.]
MKKIKVFILSVFCLFLLNSCGASNGVYNKKSTSTKLLKKMKRINSKGIMLGHEDALAYGTGWKYMGNGELDADVFRATKQFPAVLGWDLGKVGDSLNIDGVPFHHMRELMLKGHAMGAINTMSWHPFFFKGSISSWDKKEGLVKSLLPGAENHSELVTKLDKVAVFLSSLKNSRGKVIPVIFRPWHEMDGSWFWWGQKYTTIEDYKALFAFTVDYLRNTKGLKNILIAYSPDRHFYTEADYLKYYPGDEYVDILGTDNYYDFKEKGDGLDALVEKLNIVVNTAEKRDKLAALTETGSDGIPDPTWFTQKLGKVLGSNDLMSKLSYVLFWRNGKVDHFYIPHKGHASFQDFIDFTKNEKVLLLKK